MGRNCGKKRKVKQGFRKTRTFRKTFRSSARSDHRHERWLDPNLDECIHSIYPLTIEGTVEDTREGAEFRYRY